MSTRIKGGTNNGSYHYVDYTITGQSVSGNYTDISWVAGVHWGSYYFNIHDAHVDLANATFGGSLTGSTGTGTYNSGWPISGAGTNRDHAYHSGTTRVHHSSAGEGSVRFSGSAWWDTPGNYTSSFNNVVTLPTIPRAPYPPSIPSISNIGPNSVDVAFTDGSNNGSGIDSRQIGYGTNSSGPDSIVDTGNSATIDGLDQGTTYYFWARTHNAGGYSGWSTRASATTLDVPEAPSIPVLSNIQPTSVDLTWDANGDGGATIDSYQVSYALTSYDFSPTMVAISPQTVTGLVPGKTYYFAVRAHNSVGWGPWSGVASNTTIAGARINVGGVWKIAIPYVRVGGVWKQALPYVNVGGVWKEAG